MPSLHQASAAESAAVYARPQSPPRLDVRDGATGFDFRDGARHLEAREGTKCLGQLWDELRSRRVRVVESFRDERRLFLVVAHNPIVSRPPIESRDLDILERCLLGDSQKRMAYEYSISPSTTAAVLSRCLLLIGASRLRTASLTLAMAVHAYRGGTLLPKAWVTSHQRWDVISTERPELALVERLSPREWDVVEAFLDGKSYAEIAAGRAVSPRTIANQLSSVFRKLGVSGRSELIHAVLAGYAEDTARAREGFETV